MNDRDDIEKDVYEAIGAMQHALSLVDQLVLTHAETLPPRSLSRIAHSRSGANYLSTVLNTVMADVDALEDRVARRSSDRTSPGAKPEHSEFEIMMTNKMIANGNLPADATPDDFKAMQERQRAKMAKLPPAGSIAAPSGPVGIARKMRPGDDG